MQPKDVAENESAVLGSGEGLENMRLTSQVEFVWFLHKVQSSKFIGCPFGITSHTKYTISIYLQPPTTDLDYLDQCQFQHQLKPASPSQT